MKSKFFTSLFAAITLATSVAVVSAPAKAESLTINNRNTAPNEFQSILQELRAFVGEEAATLTPETINARKVDVSKLTLQYDHDVNVYFIGETAKGYRNRLDFSTTYNNQTTTGKIFGDTSCNPADSGFTNFISFCPNPNDPIAGKQSPDTPLNIGDWVNLSQNLGTFKAGTTFDFLLRANNINGGIYNNGIEGVWSVNDALNPDGLQHAVGYFYKDFLIIGFEDVWGGGDKDYNDAVFAIDFGKANNNVIANVPEPSATLALFGLGALGFLKSRRRLSTQK